MKNTIAYAILIVYCFFNAIQVFSQEPSKPMEPYEIEPTKVGEFADNLNDVFLSIIENAEYPKDKNCGSTEIFDLASTALKKYLKKFGFLTYHASLSKAEREKPLSITMGYGEKELEEKFGKGTFKTYVDKLSFALENNDSFTGFISAATGKNIGDLKPEDLSTLKIIYKVWGRLGGDIPLFEEDLYTKLSETCWMEWRPEYIRKSLDYPGVTSEFKIKVKIECACKENNTNKLKNITYEYFAEANGILTAKNYQLKKPAFPKINITSVECCPAKKEKKVSYVDPVKENNDKGGYFQVGAFVGLPLGKEADFFSANYGFNVGYSFNVSKDLVAGLGTGFSNFSGKEVNDFKTEGVSFIPVFASAEYSLTDLINAYGNLGYGIATDKGSGGVNVVLGAKYKVSKNIEVGPAFRTIIVEGGSFSSVTLGVDIGL